MRFLFAFLFVACSLARAKDPSSRPLPPVTSDTKSLSVVRVVYRTSSPPAYRTVRMRATAYSWQERAHRQTYGRQNCMGGILTELVEGCRQCAADTDIFPLGTILEVPGAGRRIVTDRGSAVEGAHHIDLHFNTLEEMFAWGTQLVSVRVIRLGWGK